MIQPRLIQTYLPDGTLEGVRIIELSESSIKAFVVPRLKLADAKDRAELKQPALYLLINSTDNEIYIGESENFFDRVRNHDQSKDFWDMAVAIVSIANTLEKSDVKYLESLAVERAKQTGAVTVLNKTVPTKNTVHEFKLHSLEKILDDLAVVAELLGFSLFADAKEDQATIWHLKTNQSLAHAQFRGDKFIVLAGSVIDKKYAASWAQAFPKSLVEREEFLAKYGKANGTTVELTENVPFKSPNHAASMTAGRSINAWTAWRDSTGRTMDEVMRKSSE
jgi:hypothetical protein